jgi:hypothetical protein
MRFIIAMCFCAVSAFGQYGGSGTSGGYKSSTGIVVGAAVAAGVVATYLIVHSHNKGKVVGCLGGSASAPTLVDDKKSSYSVLNGSGIPLTTGERMALTGKKLGRTFEVRGVTKDYGPCSQ